MEMSKRRDYVYAIVNCVALFVLAITLTAPVHEATHLLTQMAAGMDPHFLSFGVADTIGTPTANLDTAFWKVMYTGSAALMNIVVGLSLLGVLNKCRLKPLTRSFVLLLSLLHQCMGFGYLLRDGIAYFPGQDMGDWSKVLANFDGSIALRVAMLVVGSLGFLLTFYVTYREAYHFVEHNDDKKERRRVSAALYLIPYLFNLIAFTLINLNSPIGAGLSLLISGILNLFGYIPLLWGYLFVSHLVRPMRKSIFLFPLCSEKKPILWAIAAAVFLIDALVLCPGIYF